MGKNSSFLLLMIALAVLSTSAFLYFLVEDLEKDLISDLVICTGILSAMFTYFAFYASRENNEAKKISPIINFYLEKTDTEFSCHYFYDATNEDEKLSKDLRSLLDLSDRANNFSDFETVFNQDDYKKLDQMLVSTRNRLLKIESRPNKKYGGLFQPEEAKQNYKLCLLANIKGEERFLECQADPVTTGNNKPLGVIVWFKDITDYISAINNSTSKIMELEDEVDKFTTILENLQIPVWLRNKDLQITYSNPNYEKITSLSEQESKYGTPELEKHSWKIAKAAKKANKLLYEEKHIVIGGERKLFVIAEKPTYDSQIVGFGFDISSKDLIKEELSQHMSAQSDLLESSASAIAIYGKDTKLQFFNQVFVTLWGLDEKWLVTNPTYGEILELLREKRKLPEQADFRAFKREHLKLFTDLIEPHNEFFYLPDGTALRVLVIPHTFGGLLFSYEDMSDKLQLERSFNTLNAVQIATIENLYEGVAVFGEDARLKLSNKIYREMWGIDEEFAKSSPHFTEILENVRELFCYPEGEWKEFKFSIISAFNSRERIKHRLDLRNGSVIDRISTPLPDGSILMTYVDVTDSTKVEKSLRERNEYLEETDKLKTDFLANMSYELSPPVTEIISFIKTIENENFEELNKRHKEEIEGIYNSAQNLSSLINNIMDLAQLETGSKTLNVSVFDIEKTIKSITPLLTEKLKKQDIKHVFHFANDIGMVIGDEDKIKQILYRILSNSISITKKESEFFVDVRVEKTDNINMVIKITNSTSEALNHLKSEELFDKTIRSELGVSVIKNLIELHRGDINIEMSENFQVIINCIIPKCDSELSSLLEENQLEYV